MTNGSAESALAKCQQRPSTPRLCSSQVWLGGKGAVCVLSGLRHSFFSESGNGVTGALGGFGGGGQKEGLEGYCRPRFTHTLLPGEAEPSATRHPVEQKSKHPVPTTTPFKFPVPGTSGAKASIPGSPWVLAGSCILWYLCVLFGTLTLMAAITNHELQYTDKETEVQLRLRICPKLPLLP